MVRFCKDGLVGKEYVIPLYMCWDQGQKLTKDCGKNYPTYLKRGGEQIVKKNLCMLFKKKESRCFLQL